MNFYDEGISPAKIYDIDQLEAMQIADAAWNDVNTMTNRNGWCKAGILPDMDPTLEKKVIYIFTLQNLKYMYKIVCMDQNSM